MRKITIILLCIFNFLHCNAQVPEKEKQPESTNSNTEQQFENITDNGDDNETEDDSYIQQLYNYQKNPINLNYADEAEIKNLRILVLNVEYYNLCSIQI